MKYCNRILAGIVFLLAVAALLLSLAGGVGVWIVKEPATTRATQLFARIDASLTVAEQGLEHARTSLDRAAERLETARAKHAQAPRTNNAARRLLARSVQSLVAPDVGGAHQTLHTVAEAAVVLNSVLEDLGSLPFLSVSGLDVGPLTEVNNRLSVVESSAWELTRLLGEPGTDPNSDAGPPLSRIEQALTRIRRVVAEYEPQVKQVRQRTEQLKARTLSWITPAAVVVSVACFWIALSQVSLLCHACSWWRRAAHNDRGPG
jgi:hypothetical protein